MGNAQAAQHNGQSEFDELLEKLPVHLRIWLFRRIYKWCVDSTEQRNLTSFDIGYGGNNYWSDKGKKSNPKAPSLMFITGGSMYVSKKPLNPFDGVKSLYGCFGKATPGKPRELFLLLERYTLELKLPEVGGNECGVAFSRGQPTIAENAPSRALKHYIPQTHWLSSITISGDGTWIPDGASVCMSEPLRHSVTDFECCGGLHMSQDQLHELLKEFPNLSSVNISQRWFNPPLPPVLIGEKVMNLLASHNLTSLNLWSCTIDLEKIFSSKSLTRLKLSQCKSAAIDSSRIKSMPPLKEYFGACDSETLKCLVKCTSLSSLQVAMRLDDSVCAVLASMVNIQVLALVLEREDACPPSLYNVFNLPKLRSMEVRFFEMPHCDESFVANKGAFESLKIDCVTLINDSVIKLLPPSLKTLTLRGSWSGPPESVFEAIFKLPNLEKLDVSLSFPLSVIPLLKASRIRHLECLDPWNEQEKPQDVQKVKEALLECPNLTKLTYSGAYAMDIISMSRSPSGKWEQDEKTW